MRGEVHRLEAAAVCVSSGAKKERMIMTQFKIHNQVLLQLLRITAERETLDYILTEMKRDLCDDMPAEELVSAFVKAPDKPTKLSVYHQMIAMDKLLECAEINCRTLCDLVRYQYLKQAGIVHSVDEFLQMFRPEAEPDFAEEDDQ